MSENDKKNNEEVAVATSGVSRREFLAGIGGLGVGAIFTGVLGGALLLPNKVIAIPASKGYIVVDTARCAGCTSCMMACSLVHHGQTNLSLSRLQITQNPFGKFPNDIQINQCRQCPYPACVDACPTGAMHIDAANGNVRTVDESKCIGCERCVNACPFTPSRAEWNAQDRHAQKCDLCADAPYWKQKGGPGGKQACVETCPMKAISYTAEIPVQSDKGYDVDLGHTGAVWTKFGFNG